MNINRDNYEEYFVLYIDKELNAAERAAVQNFVEQNPDLKPELEMLEQTIFPADSNETFANKELLFRKETEPSNELINELNCEELFVLYADNELNNDENGMVEEFIYRHPQYQENFELIQQIKFQPEKHIVFPNKSILYRSENDHKVVPMFTRMRTWKMVAAAAVLFMIGGTVWYALNSSTGTGTTTLAGNDPAQVKPTPDKSSSQGVAAKPSSGQATDNSNSVNPEIAKSPVTEAAVASAIIVSPGISDRPNTKNYGTKNNGTKNENGVNIAALKDKPSTKTSSKDEAAIRGLNSNSNETTDKLLAENNLKKDKDQSNISDKPNVQLQKDIAKNNKSNESVTDLNNKSTRVSNNELPSDQNALLAAVPATQKGNDNTVAIGPVTLKSDNVFARMVNENEEEFEQSDKKNKMRGFFRKVTRVFDKATSREPAEERKGVRIASFSIGLK